MTIASRQSVVILGASNVRLGLSTIVKSLTSTIDGPVDLFVVGGHGRSYGLWSWIPFRGLPGIVECGLWESLGAAGTGPPAASDASGPRPLALVTDVGNDLLYGVEVPQILAWVEACLERLRRLGAEVILTLPPVSRLQRLSNWRYLATRTVFFPTSRVSWPDMLARVRALDEGLRGLGRRDGVRLVEPPLEWYGVDPIHIRCTLRRMAWDRIFSHWPEFPRHAERRALPAAPGETPSSDRPDRPGFLRLRAHRLRGPFGERLTPQPAFTGRRLSLWLY